MLRFLISAFVTCAVLFGVQAAAEAHAGCCDPPPAATASAGGHTHHASHDAPHVPHQEPDGCHHDCATCSVVAPAQAALAIPLLLSALAPAGVQSVPADRIPCGPPTTTPFPVPRS